MVAERSDRRLDGIDFNRIKVALIESMVPATKALAMAQLIERIRKVE